MSLAVARGDTRGRYVSLSHVPKSKNNRLPSIQSWMVAVVGGHASVHGEAISRLCKRTGDD